MKRIWKVTCALLAALVCPAVTLAQASVSISPTTVKVQPGGQTQFTANVTGTANSIVVWSLAGTNCTGNACGQITNTGLYLAPAVAPTPNVITVTATALQDLSASASAAVIIGSSSDITVTVSPTAATTLVGQQQQFVAFVSGTTLTGVTWKLAGAACSSSACGTISSSGVYTAPVSPPSPAQVTVEAVSVADPSRFGSAVVTVTLPVSVSVSPNSASVVTGKQQQFTATVSNTSNTAVNWSLAGSGCSGSACGSISSSGLYTAPSSVPSPAQVFITATSVADPTKSSTATVTVIPPVAVSISPTTAQLLVGKQQQFTATVTNTSNTAATWSVSGSGCSGSTCGTVSSSGLYTAPASVPSPAQVYVTATSVADPTKSATATVTIIPPVGVSISPASATVVTGKQQKFTATVNNSTNSSVTWSLSGTGCSGSTCGTISTAGLYTAPSSVPNPAQVTVKAVSVADPTKSATATVTIVPPIGIGISPTTAQLLTAGTQQFSASVTNTTNTAVTWTVAGSGCSGSACGTISSSGFYTAPGTVPTPAQVFVTATSVADPTKSATATVTIIPPVAVTISPTSVTLGTGGHQQFTATVSNTNNTAVVWSVAGSGCSGTACGTITTSGLYTAPVTVPKSAVTVTATSVADSTKSAHAQVTVTVPIAIAITPASAQISQGATQQFSATVTGTSNTAVTWSISGSGCSGASCGTITTAGLFTAPIVIPTPAQVFVTATSAADHAKSATATVTVVALIGVSISPTIATVVTSAHQQFTATLVNTTNPSVNWSVSGSGCSGSSCGTISSTGLYTAPASVPSPAQVTVKVASAADTSRFATATVTIVPPVSVTISPTTATVVAGFHQQFTSTVSGSTNTAVTWSVSGAGCSGSACGVITSTGLYSAPGAVPNPAKVTVTATSVANPTKSASATVTIRPPVGVKISPASAQVVTGEHQQFTAILTNTSNPNVTWGLSGLGCSGSTCGTISTSGLYTAPAAIPSPAQVTVTATSQADTTKTASATVTIIAPVVVSISPTSAFVAVNGQQQFEATVAGSSNTAVDWSVSGSGCSGSACGTISSSGLYTAPGSVPSPATVIVKASAQIDVSRSASSTVTIVSNPDTKFQGQYAFQFKGFDSNAVYQSAGTFAADGAGHITAGLEDVNSAAGPATSVPFTGTYTLVNDNRGIMTLSTPTGSQTFRFALNVSGTSGRMIEFDTTGIRGSGVIQQQDPTAFAVSAFRGPYVVSLSGQDSSGARIGSLAILDLDGLGNVVGGSMDVNDGGTIAPTFGAFDGIYRVDTTGRGILNLSVPGFAGGSFRFALYVVSAQKFFLVSIDPISSNNPVFSGPVEVQTGAPYLTSAFVGPTIFSLAGEQSNTSQVIVGNITFDGISQPLVQFDQNTGGTVTTGNVLTGAYAVEVNGPGTLNLDDSNGHTRVWDMYAIAPNQAFLMDISDAYVDMGELDPQTVGPVFNNSDIVGTYVLGSGEPLQPTATLDAGVATFNGKNSVSGTEDISTSSTLSATKGLAGTYSVSSTLADGRGTLLVTAPSGETIALWVASASEVLALEVDSTNPQPVVLYFQQ